MAHLIDKDALVAEIKDRLVFGSGALEIRRQEMQAGKGSSGYYKQSGVILAYNSIIKFLNTLEVKEVDLDFQLFAKEMAEVFALPASITENTEENPLNWEYAIAKHFFKLGLKAKQE